MFLSTDTAAFAVVSALSYQGLLYNIQPDGGINQYIIRKYISFASVASFPE